MTDPAPRRRKRLREYPVFPTILTAGNLACGVSAILCAMSSHGDNGLLFQGAILVFAAMVFDMFDGKVARMTGTDGEFGAELDSLADVVSFGVAPAMLVHRLVLGGQPNLVFGEGERLIWCVAVFYAVMTALRLARYNVEHSEEATTAFRGVPSPGAAALLCSWVGLYGYLAAPGEGGVARFHESILRTGLHLRFETFETWVRWGLVGGTVVAALLMVSTIRFLHVGNSLLAGRIRLGRMVLLLVLLALLIAKPWYVLVVGTTLYVGIGAGMGVVSFLWRLRRNRLEQALAELEDGIGEDDEPPPAEGAPPRP